YASAVQTCRGLSASTGWMAPGEFDRLADVQDELAMHRTRLANAGRPPAKPASGHHGARSRPPRCYGGRGS
ncbi:hypothetical protein, partial [Streptomyces swartbergensis]|uniref:hypothetical protein n=1 Tax=Streptomyces swartbergensis TaxID=487165 RepID=UPI001ABF94A7